MNILHQSIICLIRVKGKRHERASPGALTLRAIAVVHIKVNDGDTASTRGRIWLVQGVPRMVNTGELLSITLRLTPRIPIIHVW